MRTREGKPPTPMRRGLMKEIMPDGYATTDSMGSEMFWKQSSRESRRIVTNRQYDRWHEREPRREDYQ